jgi:hypothetical protein
MHASGKDTCDELRRFVLFADHQKHVKLAEQVDDVEAEASRQLREEEPSKHKKPIPKRKLSMAAKDMDWAEGLSITREEICAAYGISTIVAGGLKGATFSNYEMAMKAAWNDTLIPVGRSIASVLRPRAAASAQRSCRRRP